MSTESPKTTTNLRHPTNSEKSSTLTHSELMTFNYQKKFHQNNLGNYRKKQHSNNKDTWEQINMTQYSKKF